jgi:predicted Zn-dependent protease
VKNLEALSVAAKSVGDFDLARKTAMTLIALDPKDPAHFLLLSDIALREKKAADALRHARKPRPGQKKSM